MNSGCAISKGLKVKAKLGQRVRESHILTSSVGQTVKIHKQGIQRFKRSFEEERGRTLKVVLPSVETGSSTVLYVGVLVVTGKDTGMKGLY